MKKIIAILGASILAATIMTSAVALDEPVDPAEDSLAWRGGVTYLSSQDPVSPAANAFDASTSTYWSASKDPALKADGTFENEIYLGVNFGMAVTFDKVTAEFSVDRPAAADGSYKIQISDDGETWSDAEGATYTYAEFTAEWEKIDEHTVDTVVFETPVTAQYVRMLIVKPCINLKTNQTVYELGIYDTTGEANPDFPMDTVSSEVSSENDTSSEPQAGGTSSVESAAASSSSSSVSSTVSEPADDGAENGMIVPLIIAAAVIVAAVVVVVLVVKKKK